MSSAPWSASWAATRRSRALRTAYHIVRSEPEARVLAVTVELCTLHLQETPGSSSRCSPCSSSATAPRRPWSRAEPAGLRDEPSLLLRARGFGRADPVEDRRHRLRDDPVRRGAGADPARARGRRACARRSTTAGAPDEVDSWAVHAGGRSILDAVEKGLELPQGALCSPRATCSRATATCPPRP